MSFSNMPREVVNRNILLAVWAIGLFAQMDALHVIVQQFLGLKLLLAVGTLIIANFLVEIFDMVVEILVLFVADMTGGSLRQMNLFDVILQRVLGYKVDTQPSLRGWTGCACPGASLAYHRCDRTLWVHRHLRLLASYPSQWSLQARLKWRSHPEKNRP